MLMSVDTTSILVNMIVEIQLGLIYAVVELATV